MVIKESTSRIILLSIAVAIGFDLVSCYEESTNVLNSGNAEIDRNIEVLVDELHGWLSLEEQTIDNIPFHMHKMVESLNGSINSANLNDKLNRILFDVNLCLPCETGVALIIAYTRIGLPTSIIEKFMSIICSLFIYTGENVCSGIIHEAFETITYIIKNSLVDSTQFCKLVRPQDCGHFKGTSWSVAIPKRTYSGGQPQIRDVNPRSYLRNDTHALKILHLTDPHFDPDYEVGSNAVCGAPMCCNADSGNVAQSSDKAGLWGDARDCDSPKWLIENMFKHIQTNHPDIDFIFYTGDIVSHYLWKGDKETNLHVMDELANLITEYFPTTVVYGALGNHDSIPVNSFPPPECEEVFELFSNQWLYDDAVQSWETLNLGIPLPSEATFAGYYSLSIRPDLLLISLNTNFCYVFNWWILYKSNDPANVLNWLVGELQAAEDNSQFVLIIGHVPPLHDDCIAQWSEQFSRIITRYSNIIRGQFYGHTHADELRIHYDSMETDIPIGIQYVTPNNGPFTGVNPAYRIFYVDGDHSETTRNVLDYDTYVMNLTRANLYNDPLWYKLYSAKHDLELPDLLPHSWNNFVQRLKDDEEYFQKYYRYHVQDSDTFIAKGCDYICKMKIIEDIVQGNAYLRDDYK